MSSINQLFSLSVNFIYGVILFYVTIINYHFIKDETIIVKIFISLIFMLDYTFIYLLTIYKLFSGIMHPYYLITFLLGYFVGYKLKWHVKVMSSVTKLIDFLKKKL